MASSLSHLQMVVLLRVAMRPERRTCEPSSARLHRESGSPSFAGSSQAMALTRTTSSGGEDPGPSGAWAVIETTEALLKEAFTPHADDFTSCGEVVCDVLIGEALVSQEDHLGANDLIIRQRIFVSSPRQLLDLLSGQQNSKWAGSWHSYPLPEPRRGYQKSAVGASPYTFTYLWSRVLRDTGDRGQDRAARTGGRPDGSVRGGVPQVLVRIPAWAWVPRRSARAWSSHRAGPSELGGRGGHQGVLRQRGPRVAAEDGDPSCQRRAGASTDPAHAGGRCDGGGQTSRNGKGHPAGGSDLSAAGEHLPALRARRVVRQGGEARLPGGSVSCEIRGRLCRLFSVRGGCPPVPHGSRWTPGEVSA